MRIPVFLFPVLASCTELRSRATNAISTCGTKWMPAEDVRIGQGTDTRRGFNSAVHVFCEAASGNTIQPGKFLSMATEVFLSDGKDPSVYGIVGFLYFEIHNKQDTDHVISGEMCERYLTALSASGGMCSGSLHGDTKGGTWQVGNNGVSYHALGNEAPPKQNGLNKLYTESVLDPQTINKRSGPALDPWPLDSLNDVKPTNCHSHNDYDRNIPLFSAMSAGCISIEADVFYSNGDVIIGHTFPTPGRTLGVQYVSPLRAILDHNNGGSPGDNGLYKASPRQSITLLVDFKTSDSRTLDAVVAALQPLRQGGYLSHVSAGNFIEKQVTVVASGSAPFDRIASGDGVPDRDVFYDAKLDAWDAKYNSSNAFYASANIKTAVGNPNSVGAFSQSERNTVETQVQQSHAKGLKVRYWDLPGDFMWEPLMELGVDRLNADDMYDTARLPRVN